MVLATIAALLSLLGVLMVVMSLASRSENPVGARVRDLAARLSEEQGTDLTRPFGQRVVWPLFEGIANAFARLLPSTLVSRISYLLILAGAGFGGMQVLGLIAFTVMGLYLPYFWLSRRVGRRQSEILKTLPNALDLVTTCVEAGLGLDSAFAKVAERLPGPFGDELAHALRDMSLGRSRRDALRDIGERTGVPDVITFVNSIVHAETTGSSIADLLRVQADQTRMRRRQRVEQIAQRIPIWMTFPLVVFLLPSLFIAILGPAIIQVIDSLA